MLEMVKLALGITGNYHDATLLLYIDEVLHYMESAGVPKNVLQSDLIHGCVARGVSDLWNYGQGNATLSPYFHQRVIQLVREV